MRKIYWFGLVLLLTLVLSACAQQTAEPQPTPVPPTEEVEPSPTQEEEAPAPTAVESGEMSGAAQCGPYNLVDQILGNTNPNLAAVTEDDHVYGAETAAMTIIEYSDYQ